VCAHLSFNCGPADSMSKRKLVDFWEEQTSVIKQGARHPRKF